MPVTVADALRGPDWRAFDPREFTVGPGAAMNISIPLELSQHRIQLLRNGEPVGGAQVKIATPAQASHSMAGKTFRADADGWIEPTLSHGGWKITLSPESGAGGGAINTAHDLPWPPPASTFDL